MIINMNAFHVISSRLSREITAVDVMPAGCCVKIPLEASTTSSSFIYEWEVNQSVNRTSRHAEVNDRHAVVSTSQPAGIPASGDKYKDRHPAVDVKAGRQNSN